ncbi:hypothetical protein HanRHA438_Chr11g0482591 [Helianthus annuus]|nr:hypothetical protein HanRHA438_Chr11g0482591 [Helianthus annuus]
MSTSPLKIFFQESSRSFDPLSAAETETLRFPITDALQVFDEMRQRKKAEIRCSVHELLSFGVKNYCV